MLKHVTDADFDQLVLNEKRPVLVDFWATWCGPCKAMSPTLDALAIEYEGILEIAKVNVDENMNTRDRFGIRGLPTLALFKNGQEVARVLGLQSRTKLCDFLGQHLSAAPEKKAGASTPTQVFSGNAAQKTAAITRMEQFITHGYTEENPYTLPVCAAGGAKTEDEAARVLGVPVSLISAVDILSTYYGTAADGNAFVLSWLKALPVGANLSALSCELLLDILESPEIRAALSGDEAFSELQRHITLHHREDPGFDGWGHLREAVGKQIIGKTGILRTVGKCLQTACWPADNPDVLTETIRSAAFVPATKVSEEMGWTMEEQKNADTLLQACAQTLIAKNGSPEGALDLMAQDHPEFAERYSVHSNRYYNAMRGFGQFVGNTLISRTKATKA